MAKSATELRRLLERMKRGLPPPSAWGMMDSQLQTTLQLDRVQAQLKKNLPLVKEKILQLRQELDRRYKHRIEKIKSTLRCALRDRRHRALLKKLEEALEK